MPSNANEQGQRVSSHYHGDDLCWLDDQPPPPDYSGVRLCDLLPSVSASRGGIRFLRGDEPEAIARQARWGAEWRALRQRWARVYDPVWGRAEGRTRWSIELHRPVFGHSDSGPAPDRPHCGACWPDEYTGSPQDWPCEPFRELRRRVAKRREGADVER